MIVKKMYKYLGLNGILTTDILIDSPVRTNLYSLRADAGKILTDGVQMVHTAIIPVEDYDKWSEIDDIQADSN